MTIHQQPAQPFKFTVVGLGAFVCIGLLGAMLVACDHVSSPDRMKNVTTGKAISAGGGNTPAKSSKQLAALRRATARFHNIEQAKDAGYTVVFMERCFTDPDEGAMGFHYVDPDLLDEAVDVTEPEALMYEPRMNGKHRLVGVEYVVPFTSVPKTADPPELFARQFHADHEFDLWTLHVWVWRHNPSGLFAHWNPRVSCASADS